MNRWLTFFIVVASLGTVACDKSEEFDDVQSIVAPADNGTSKETPKVKEMPKETKPVSPAGTVRFSGPDQYGKVGPLRWTTPEGWTGMKPSSTMRLAEYTVVGEEGKEPATVTVFYFGRGQGGSVEMNINRWVGQFTTESGESAKDVTKRETKTIDGMKVHLVDTFGTYNAGMAGGNVPPKPNQRMMGAIVESDAGNYFFKLVGPKEGVDKNETKFTAFIESFKKGT